MVVLWWSGGVMLAGGRLVMRERWTKMMEESYGGIGWSGAVMSDRVL